MARVKAAGGWIGDGRVCDVLAVSRAFGDWEFKGTNTGTLLEEGVKYKWWDQTFADGVTFTGDLVVASPAVSVTEVSEEAGDEFVVVATDGLWCGLQL
jgi:protein phosphatase 1A